MHEIMIEINQFENLRKELLELRKLMDYKNSGFCKKKLESIIKKYFRINKKRWN